MTTEFTPDPELVELTLRHQPDLPPEFFTDLVVVTSDLAAARRPSEFRLRGPEDHPAPGGWSTRVREAILHELHLLICTKDPKYRDVRAGGKALSKPAASAVAGALGTVLAGVPAGLITGAVAYFLLMVAKIGANVFCRVYSPPPAQG